MHLQSYLKTKKERGEKILSIYLTAGYKSPDYTLPLLHAIAEAGADLIELGIPFSDPLADGAVIQAASHEALLAGASLSSAIETARAFSSAHTTQLLLMGYVNPFMKFGWDRLVSATSDAGVSGFIIPDLPPEECQDLQAKLKAAGQSLIYLATPHSTDERIRLMDERSDSFIYAVSVAGVTGTRSELPAASYDFLRRLRQQTNHPFLVGFGVSNAETAKTLGRLSDGVIIGSAIIKIVAASTSVDDACKKVRQFILEIKRALQEG